MKTENKAFLKFALTALIVSAAISGFTLFARNHGWLTSLETAMLDTVLKLNRSPANHVFVVGITDDDYRDIFASRSPLQCKQLERVLAAILSGEPKVLVVDIDTSDDSFRALDLSPALSTIVWARGITHPRVENETASVPPPQEHGYYRTTSLGLVPAAAQNNRANVTAVAILPEDLDGVVRWYYRLVTPRRKAPESSPSTASPTLDTVPWAAVKAYRDCRRAEPGTSYDEFLIAFSGGQQRIPHMSSGNLLSTYHGTGWKKLIRGKIVILGGYYEAARDIYATPVGRMTGVDILAQAIESELQHGGITRLNNWILFVAQALTIMLLMLLNWRFGGLAAFIAGFVVIPLLALACSVFFLSSFAFWADSAPVLFAVQLYYVFVHIIKVQKTNRNLAHANDELERNKAEIARKKEDLQRSYDELEESKNEVERRNDALAHANQELEQKQSEIDQTNRDLERANYKLNETRLELATAIEQGAEDERTRLADELHNDTLVRLREVRLKLEGLLLDPPLQEHQRLMVADAHIKVLAITERCRMIMDNLYSPMLDGYKFAPAIRQLADSVSKLADDNVVKLPADINKGLHAAIVGLNDRAAAKNLDRIGPNSRLLIYRVIQESLNNAWKHARARQARIVFQSPDGILVVSVEDNGTGMYFSLRKAMVGRSLLRPGTSTLYSRNYSTSTQNTRRHRAFGIQGIRAKAAILGGTAAWSKSPYFNSGTMVRLLIPTPVHGGHAAR